MTFTAVAPLDHSEACSESLKADIRKMIVVGNVPELGAWSLLKGITLVQEKAGMTMNIREIGVLPCTISICLIGCTLP